MRIGRRNASSREHSPTLSPPAFHPQSSLEIEGITLQSNLPSPMPSPCSPLNEGAYFEANGVYSGANSFASYNALQSKHDELHRELETARAERDYYRSAMEERGRQVERLEEQRDSAQAESESAAFDSELVPIEQLSAARAKLDAQSEQLAAVCIERDMLTELLATVRAERDSQAELLEAADERQVTLVEASRVASDGVAPVRQPVSYTSDLCRAIDCRVLALDLHELEATAMRGVQLAGRGRGAPAASILEPGSPLGSKPMRRRSSSLPMWPPHPPPASSSPTPQLPQGRMISVAISTPPPVPSSEPSPARPPSAPNHVFSVVSPAALAVWQGKANSTRPHESPAPRIGWVPLVGTASVRKRSQSFEARPLKSSAKPAPPHRKRSVSYTAGGVWGGIPLHLREVREWSPLGSRLSWPPQLVDGEGKPADGGGAPLWDARARAEPAGPPLSSHSSDPRASGRESELAARMAAARATLTDAIALVASDEIAAAQVAPAAAPAPMSLVASWDDAIRLRAELRCALAVVKQTDCELHVARNSAARAPSPH